MAAIVTDLQLINTNSTADATTGYTRIGGPAATNPAVDPDVKIQGTNCMKDANITTTVFPTDSGMSMNAFTAINLTGKLLYSWRNQSYPSNLPYKGQYGGAAIWISSGATYSTSPYKVFDLDGQDTDLVGGWKCYAVDASRTSGKTAGSLSLTAVTSVGWTRMILTTIAVAMNYVDASRYGTGLKIRDNSSITGYGSTLAEIYSYDSTSTNSYGVITSQSGIYYLMGKLYIGGNDTTYPTTNDNQGALTYFKDTDQTIIWRSMPVTTGFYEVRVASNATQHTVAQIGNYDPVTGLTSNGLTIKGSVDKGAMASQQETPGTLTNVAMYTGSRIGAGQSFTCDVVGAKVDNVQFLMSKIAAPTGNLQVKLYAHSGTLGTSSVPSGAPLAYSDVVNSTTLTNTFGWVKFPFTGANAYTMTDATNYVVAVETTGGTSSATNYVNVVTNGSSVHPGNWSSNTAGAWTATATTDLVYKLYTTNPPANWKLNAPNTNSTNVIKVYGSTLNDMYSATLNNNRRTQTVSSVTTISSSTTLTTTNNWTTSFIVPGMLVTGTGIQDGTYVNSIESNVSLTLTKTASASGTITATFTDKTEIIGCTFNNFGTVTTNGAYIYNTTFQNLATTAPILANVAINIDSTTQMNGNVVNCKFINCNRAIRITTAGSYTFDALTFSGNNYDIENSSAGAVTITLLNGSNATTYINTNGGTTTINSPKTFTVTNIINGSSVRLVKQSDLSTLGNVTVVGASPSGLTNMTVTSDTQNAGRYTATYSYNYTSDIPIYVIVFNTAYQAIRTTTTLTSTTGSFQISQVVDRQYSNPA